MSAVGACAPAGDRTVIRNFLRARCETNESSRDCRIANLTTEGVFVESYVPAVTGSRIKLRFQLPNGHHICTNGFVSDHRFQVGFSVQFVDLSSHDRDQIERLVG